MSQLFPGDWMKGSSQRTHFVWSLTFRCGKSPWNPSTPMEFSNFSCEKLAFFFLLLKAFQFWGVYVTNGVFEILNFHGLHLETKQGICSTHPICSFHLLLRVWSWQQMLGALEDTLAHHNKLPFQKKKKKKAPQSRLVLMLVNLSLSMECGKTRSAWKVDGKMFKWKGTWHSSAEGNNEEGRF